MIKTRTRFWLLIGLILIVLPAGLLTAISWYFLSQLGELLENNRQQEIVQRALQLQAYEKDLLNRCRLYLISQWSSSEDNELSGLFQEKVRCDPHFHPHITKQRPNWELNPGRELDEMVRLSQIDRESSSLLNRLEPIKDDDQQLIKLLLLARSFEKKGLFDEAQRELFKIAVRFPMREEAVFAMVRYLEINAKEPNVLKIKLALSRLFLLFNVKDREGALKIFVQDRLKKLSVPESLEDLSQRVFTILNQSNQQVSSRERFLKTLSKYQSQLVQAKKNQHSLLKLGSQWWMLVEDPEDESVLVVLIDKKKWQDNLQNYWKGQRGSFLLNLQLSERPNKKSENDRTVSDEVKLLFPQSSAQISVAPQDQTTFLFTQQLRYGSWGTILLAFLLVLGTLMALVITIQAEKVSQLKTNFVSTVSHELRTPLTSIRMFIETLRQGRIQNEQERENSYQIIEKETLRLKRLIDRLLAFSDLEKGKAHFKKEPVALDRICRHCLQLVSPQFEASQIKINTIIPDEEIEIFGNGNALIEILINLLSNSLKYSNDGKEVDFELQKDDKQAIILVKDRGPGISVKDKKKIFEPFFRSQEDTLKNAEGIGLGLSLVKEYVDWHGGKVQIIDRDGGGTVFKIVLPRGVT